MSNKHNTKLKDRDACLGRSEDDVTHRPLHSVSALLIPLCCSPSYSELCSGEIKDKIGSDFIDLTAGEFSCYAAHKQYTVQRQKIEGGMMNRGKVFKLKNDSYTGLKSKYLNVAIIKTIR